MINVYEFVKKENDQNLDVLIDQFYYGFLVFHVFFFFKCYRVFLLQVSCTNKWGIFPLSSSLLHSYLIKIFLCLSKIKVVLELPSSQVSSTKPPAQHRTSSFATLQFSLSVGPMRIDLFRKSQKPSFRICHVVFGLVLSKSSPTRSLSL